MLAGFQWDGHGKNGNSQNKILKFELKSLQMQSSFAT